MGLNTLVLGLMLLLGFGALSRRLLLKRAILISVSLCIRAIDDRSSPRSGSVWCRGRGPTALTQQNPTTLSVGIGPHRINRSNNDGK